MARSVTRRAANGGNGGIALPAGIRVVVSNNNRLQRFADDSEPCVVRVAHARRHSLLRRLTERACRDARTSFHENARECNLAKKSGRSRIACESSVSSSERCSSGFSFLRPSRWRDRAPRVQIYHASLLVTFTNSKSDRPGTGMREDSSVA